MEGSTPEEFILKSEAFEPDAEIPLRHTMTEFSPESQNISPGFEWKGVPDGAESLVLLCIDPDAVGGDFVHWVVYNMIPAMTMLPSGLPSEATVTLDDVKLCEGGPFVPHMLIQSSVGLDDVSVMQGTNDFGFVGYGGPKPPPGTGVHHYTFTLYALKTILDCGPGVSHKEVTKLMEDAIIAKTSVIGIVNSAE